MRERFDRGIEALRTCAAVLLVSLTAACGGGGGGGGGDPSAGSDGVLRVSLGYTDSAWLLQPSLVRPTFSGLEGHAANCTLESGSVPPGMQLNGDCSISGIPTAAGSFAFGIRLSASGVSNQLALNVGVTVFGPSVVYSFPSRLVLGESVDLPLLSVFWRPRPDIKVTYSVMEGALPTGITIDATTGRLQGAATAEGIFSFRIGATVTAPAGTATVRQEFPDYTQVGGMALRYLPADDVGGWLGLPIQATVYGLQPGASYHFAWDPDDTPPPGLQLDPKTGTISGTPEVALERSFRIGVTMTRQGQSASGWLALRLHLMPPVYLNYNCAAGTVDTPYVCPPTYINNSGQPLTGAVPRYSLVEGLIPAGLSLDPETGVISGTPTGPMTAHNVYAVDIILNGVRLQVLSSPITLHIAN